MRNATCTTVAPTGTISILAGCSCGIEPLYSLAFYRNVLRGQKQGEKPMIEVNSIFEKVAREHGWFSEELMDQIARDGTLADIDNVPEEARRVFVCAHDVSPDWHVRMQAAFQEHCDASISKTINFPESATVDDVARIYLESYRLRCKGVTVYRNGCREHQPMALKEKEGTKSQTRISRPTPEPMDMHDISCAVRVRQITPFGNMHVQITVDPKNEQEVEVFAQLGKGGDLATSDLEAICRLISLWLRSGGKLHHVIRQLKGIGSSLQIPTKEGKVRSLGDALSRALDKYARAKTKLGLKNLLTGQFDFADLQEGLVSPPGLGNGHETKEGNGNGNGNGNGHGSKPVNGGAARLSRVMESSRPEDHFRLVCPDCQNPLRRAEGCVKCECCGFSQC